MKIDDLTLGLLVLFGAIAALASSFAFSPIPGQAYGADTMPRVIGLVGVVLAAVLIVRAVRAGARVPGVFRTGWARSPRALGNLALTLALIVAYIAFSETLGFIPIAFAIVVLLMLALGVRPVVAVIVSLCAAFAVQAAFGRLLLVPLPRGPLFDMFW